MSAAVRRIIVMRHGETTWNVEGRRQGQLDSPLTSRGHEQALQAVNTLHAMGVDAIYSSPLGRAASTASTIAAALALPVHTVDEAREIDHGTFAGLTDEEIEARHPGALIQRAAEKYLWRFPDGESYADATNRADRLVELIRNTTWATPLIVTHEMFARVLVARLSGQPPREMLKWRLSHGSFIDVDVPFRPHTSDDGQSIRAASEDRGG